MFIKNLNDAQYVRVFEDSPMGDILMVWYGSDLITLLDGETLEEFDCFSDNGITDWRDAHGVMTGHMDGLEDAQAEQDYLDEVGYQEAQDEARTAWLAS